MPQAFRWKRLRSAVFSAVTHILCVCLNPSIDVSAGLERLVPLGVNRAGERVETPAGKAVNVAIAARRLGMRATLGGFLFEQGGHAERLAAEGVECACAIMPGRPRENIKLIERESGRATEINFPGAQVSAGDIRRAMEAVDARAPGADFIVLSGSLPPGCDPGIYASMIARWGKKCLLDASGEALVRALAAGPGLVKPNEEELLALTGRRAENLHEAAQGALELCRMGAARAVVSLGAKGAAAACGGAAWTACAPAIRAGGSVGAGDCMVAGLAYGLAKGMDMGGALRCGVAAGSAGVLPGSTGLLQKDDFDRLLDGVRADRVL